MQKNRFFLLITIVVCMFAVGCSNDDIPLPDEPVKPEITLGKQNIEYLLGQYCWFGTKTEGICATPLPPNIFNKQVKEKAIAAEPGRVISIKFANQPDDFTLTVTDPSGVEESIGKPDQYKYNLPQKAGYYHYTLGAVWDERNTVTYHFGIHAND